MAAPVANTNASKWTEEKTKDYLAKIEDMALTGRVLTLGSALTAVRLYQGIWHYWKKRWAAHEEIMDTIYFIEQIYINVLVEGGLTKTLHSGQCAFVLRHNYGYGQGPEKQEQIEEQITPLLAESLTAPAEKFTETKTPLTIHTSALPHLSAVGRPEVITEHKKEIQQRLGHEDSAVQVAA